ncbi:CHD3-type chromatin-remodeling factor PICKLE-like [Salvia splendens]|uniref:CHD3-type chromatin-remodeling factor PICKLE-like n=1 Tax=Salvia splendens TaxID=180675 RepID=UPI001C2683C3|nr:CHD3-type chromatin-remodeling factor PICKLE-like [Salvia splendens]
MEGKNASVYCMSYLLKVLSDGSSVFKDDIISRYPGLKGGRVWKDHHDKLLLRAVMKHGYGRWQAIVDDKDLRIQEVICQELNLPFINTPAPGATQVQNAMGTSQAQASASGVPPPQVSNPGISQSTNGVNSEHAEAPGNDAKGTTAGSEATPDIAHGATDTTSRPGHNFSKTSPCCTISGRCREDKLNLSRKGFCF